MERDYTKPIFFVLLFFAFILMGFLCKVLSSVLIPVAIAIFMALAFYPVVRNLEAKAKIKWGIGTLLVVALLLIVIASVSSILVKGVSTIANEYSKLSVCFYLLLHLLFDFLILLFLTTKMQT